MLALDKSCAQERRSDPLLGAAVGVPVVDILEKAREGRVPDFQLNACVQPMGHINGRDGALDSLNFEPLTLKRCTRRTLPTR